MFGAELTELIAFARQIGLALAGAAALWGAVFFFRARHKPGTAHCLVYEWIASRLLVPFYFGLALAAASWLYLSSLLGASAHEGVSLAPPSPDTLGALGLFGPVLTAWAIFAIAALVLKYLAPRKFNRLLGWFYIFSFLFAVVLISFPVWSGEFSLNQWFFIGHSLHSIFTVGTVLVLDFLLLMAGTSTHLKQHIFPWFGTMSKVIWVGLGIDFLSVALIFGQALTLTPKFFFMQTVLGILIINGVLLSGPITRRLLSSIGKGAQALTKRWARIADISGIVSISSWLTITFVDSFTNLTLSYLDFVLFYLALLGLASLGRKIWAEIEKRRRPEFSPVS